MIRKGRNSRSPGERGALTPKLRPRHACLGIKKEKYHVDWSTSQPQSSLFQLRPALQWPTRKNNGHPFRSGTRLKEALHATGVRQRRCRNCRRALTELAWTAVLSSSCHSSICTPSRYCSMRRNGKHWTSRTSYHRAYRLQLRIMISHKREHQVQSHRTQHVNARLINPVILALVVRVFGKQNTVMTISRVYDVIIGSNT